MNKFERLKTMDSSEALKYLEKVLGKEQAQEFFKEEKLFTPVKNAEVGSFILYAGIEWVVLEQTKKGALLFAKQRLFDRAFDTNEKNDWSKSSLRKELNNFNEKGMQRGFEHTENINKNDLVEFERDLTTDDGMTDYGKCKDYLSLITCEEYRKYRGLISNADDWWWTATGDSLVYSYFVRIVYSGGALSHYYARNGSYGVRPLCILKSETEVEICEK